MTTYSLIQPEIGEVSAMQAVNSRDKAAPSERPHSPRDIE
jgi:hypothetical protein